MSKGEKRDNYSRYRISGAGKVSAMKNTNTQTPSFLAGLVNNATQPETLRILQTLVITYWNESKICPSDRAKLNRMIAAKQGRIAMEVIAKINTTQ